MANPGEAVRKKAALIAGVAGLVTVATVAHLVMQPRQYEAAVTLMASPSKLGDPPNSLVAAANYVPQIQNPSIVADVIKEFDLASPPRSLTVAGFLRGVLHVNALSGTTLFDVRARLDSPDLASKVANRIAERAVEWTRRLSQDEAGGVQGQLKRQLDATKTRYDASTASLEALRKAAQLDALMKEVEALLDERRNLLPFSLQIEERRARLARGEKELAARPRIDIITRAFDADPALLEVVRGAAGGRLLDLKLKNEQISAVHETLATEVSRIRAELDGLLQRLAQTERAVGGLGAKLNRMYELQRALADGQLDAQIAQKAYEQAANQYENARLQVSQRSAQLQIVSPALPPELPLSRRLVLNALLAFTLTASFVAAAVAMMAYRR